MACRLIAYYRVSTDKQGKSGLGLKGQVTAVEAYSRHSGCEVVASYTEVETSTKNTTSNRPELAKALAHARFCGGTLVIAKLDRFSRNVAFLSNLMESGVEFVACDLPNASKLTLHLMVAVAEDEARRTSERTTVALQAYKDSGAISKRIRLIYPEGVPQDVVDATAGKLGAELEQCRNLNQAAREKGAKTRGEEIKAAAAQRNAFIAPRIIAMRAEGLTLQRIADTLNAEGLHTTTGKNWGHVQVKNILDRNA